MPLLGLQGLSSRTQHLTENPSPASSVLSSALLRYPQGTDPKQNFWRVSIRKEVGGE